MGYSAGLDIEVQPLGDVSRGSVTDPDRPRPTRVQTRLMFGCPILFDWSGTCVALRTMMRKQIGVGLLGGCLCLLVWLGMLGGVPAGRDGLAWAGSLAPVPEQGEEPAALTDRCLASLLQDELLEAIATCDQALQHGPSNDQAYLYRGLAYYRLGQYAAAIADLTQRLQHQPDAQGYYNRGLARAALGQSSLAIADFHQALALTTDPVVRGNVWNDIGVVHLEQAQVEQAIADFDQAIAMDHLDARAHYNRGCACHRSGDYEGALADFDRALQLSDGDGTIYFHRGRVRHRLGDIEGAIADMQQADYYLSQTGQLDASRQARRAWQRWQQALIQVG
jgi:tetratricopeptide (TPR) repeat protein